MTHGTKVLAIAPFYRTFIKDSLSATAPLVKGIHLLVPHNVFSEIATKIPFGGFFSHVRQFAGRNLIDLPISHPGVDVSLIDLRYLIPDRRNPYLGDLLFKEVDRFISERKIEFDIVQGHFTWPTGYAAVRIAQKYKVPSIIVVHESRDWLYEMINSKNTRFSWTWRNASVLVRVNKLDVPLLSKFNSKVITSAGGFDPTRFFPIDRKAARLHLGIPPEKKVLFTLGVHEKRKGFEYLIRALGEYSKLNSNVTCIIGGDGPIRTDLEAMAHEFGLAGVVRFLGFVKSCDLVYYYNAADLFVLPSLSEGNPTVMFESIGCGTPFLGTRVGGTEEIITSDEFGLLVKPADSRELEEKIEIGLQRDWNRELIRNHSMNFTWDKNARTFADLYGDLVADLPSGRICW